MRGAGDDAATDAVALRPGGFDPWIRDALIIAAGTLPALAWLRLVELLTLRPFLLAGGWLLAPLFVAAVTLVRRRVIGPRPGRWTLAWDSSRVIFRGPSEAHPIDWRAVQYAVEGDYAVIRDERGRQLVLTRAPVVVRALSRAAVHPRRFDAVCAALRARGRRLDALTAEIATLRRRAWRELVATSLSAAIAQIGAIGVLTLMFCTAVRYPGLSTAGNLQVPHLDCYPPHEALELSAWRFAAGMTPLIVLVIVRRLRDLHLLRRVEPLPPLDALPTAGPYKGASGPPIQRPAADSTARQRQRRQLRWEVATALLLLLGGIVPLSLSFAGVNRHWRWPGRTELYQLCILRERPAGLHRPQRRLWRFN